MVDMPERCHVQHAGPAQQGVPVPHAIQNRIDTPDGRLITILKHTSSLLCSDFSTASLAMTQAMAPVSAPAYSAFRSCAMGTASVCTLQQWDA
jgi:hypothetical protein